MRKAKTYFSIFVILAGVCLSGWVYGQTHKADSLKKLLEKELPDSTRYRALEDYYLEIRFSDPLRALDCAKEALAIATKEGHQRRMAGAYSKLGLIYGDLGNLALSLENQLASLKLFEELKDTLQTAGAQLNVGLVYRKQGMRTKAIEWLEMALVNFRKMKSRLGEAYTYNNLAMGEREMRKFDEALDYYSKSLAIKEELHDSASLGNGYLNIGLIWEDKGDRKKALEYYRRALEAYKATNNLKGFSGVYNNMGTLLMDEGKAAEGKDILLQSLEYARKVNSKEDEMEAEKNLSRCFELLGDYGSALEHFNRYRDCRDSVNNGEGARQIARLEVLYETDKKDRLLESLKKDAQINEERGAKERIWIIGTGAGIVLALVLFLLVINRARIREKSNRMLASTNARINTRRKEITDSISYAKRIQDSILPRFSSFSDVIPESFLLHRPRQIVSGDFYWVHRKGNVLYAAVADNFLHGVPGAFISMVGVNILNSAVEDQNITALPQLIARIEKEMDEMIGELKRESGQRRLDLSICRLNLDTHILEFSGTDNPLYLVSNKGVREIRGLDEANKPVSVKLELKKGETVYMFTDGYADQIGGGEGKKLLVRKVSEILYLNWPVPMSKQKEALFHEFEKWRGTLEQVDDVLVMGVRV